MNKNILVSVIINNYNYSRFLKEAIESILSQSYQMFEIIVVDDGSTDNSIELLTEHYSIHKKIFTIAKTNAGQLSCFNVGVKAAKGEIIFFLDSDDTYKSTYLEEIVNIYQKNPKFDFVFCSLEEFGNSNNMQTYKNAKEDIDFGITFLDILVLKSWIGMQTSAISVKKEVLEKFLPIPYLSDWITRADDCIVWGASLAGARKYYLAKPLVNYRIHGNNAYFGKKFDDIYSYQRELAIFRLFNFFKKKLGYPQITTSLIIKEFKTIPSPTEQDIRHYIEVAKVLQIGIFKRLKLKYELYKVFAKNNSETRL
jgi:glycosyltransferase involved in cell wall biosynthesis